MPASRDQLFERLTELGIQTRTNEHAAVFTVAESSALERDLPGGHTKNLFLKDAKGKLFLVIAGGTRPSISSRCTRCSDVRGSASDVQSC